MRCKTSYEITGALRYRPVTRQARCLTDVKCALKLTSYCLHLFTLLRANKPKKLPTLNSQSVSSPWLKYRLRTRSAIHAMLYTLDHDTIVILDGCLPLLSDVLGLAVLTCGGFREAQYGDATSIKYNDITCRQMTPNLVIFPGCPKAEKRTPSFPSSSRATLPQRPPDNRRRHKTLARNMDRAILGDRNGR